MPSALHLVPHRDRPRTRQHTGAGVASGALNLWSSQKGNAQSALTSAQSYASQLSISISPPVTIQAGDYVFNTDLFASVGVDPLAVANIVDLVANGQYAAAAIASIELTMATVGGPVGMAASAIIGAIMILDNDQGSPCTVPGCGGTFNMQECPQGNLFTYDAIAAALPAVPPLQPYHFSGNPNQGPSNLLDWGSYDWGQGSSTAIYRGGPGSFEEAFQQALMSAWDTAAQAPIVCQTIQALIAPPPGTPQGPFGPVDNGDGSVMGPDPGSAATRAAVWVALCMTAGALLAAFSKAWNAAHPGPQRKITYSIPTPGAMPGERPHRAGLLGAGMGERDRCGQERCEPDLLDRRQRSARRRVHPIGVLAARGPGRRCVWGPQPQRDQQDPARGDSHLVVVVVVVVVVPVHVRRDPGHPDAGDHACRCCGCRCAFDRHDAHHVRRDPGHPDALVRSPRRARSGSGRFWASRARWRSVGPSSPRASCWRGVLPDSFRRSNRFRVVV